jgi:hypothetical protein
MVVRGDDHDPAGLSQVAQGPDHRLHLDVVQGRGGFVGQQQRRVVGQRAGDRDPLLLATGQHPRPVSHALGQPEPRKQLLGPRPRGAPVEAGQAQWRLDVLPGGQAGQQLEPLEDQADPASAVPGQLPRVEPGKVGAVQRDAAGLRGEDPGQAGQQGGLAATTGAEQQDQFAGMGLGLEAVQRTHDVVTAGELHGQIADRK